MRTMPARLGERSTRRAAPDGGPPPAPAAVAGGEPRSLRIAMVGTGPRGIAVLERLGARLAARPPARPVEVLVLDTVQVGCGRIWRTNQPEHLLMNTPAGEVTMFSGPPALRPSGRQSGHGLTQRPASGSGGGRP